MSTFPTATPDEPLPSVRQVSGDIRVISARRSVLGRAAEVWRYRELLGGLIRKELKVRYKDSALGFAWSLLNPALNLVVYFFVFRIVARNNVPRFAIFLLSGLLVWNLFSAAVSGGTSSIVANSSIIKKVAFPREILPLAAAGAALVHFFLQTLVLLAALAVFQHAPSPQYLLLVIPTLAVLVLLGSGIGILLGAINVHLRDTQHLLELVLMAWFWLTPIVYPLALPLVALDRNGLTWLYLLNPLTPIVVTFQRAIYNNLAPVGVDGTVVQVLPAESVGWYITHVGIVGAIAVVIFYIALVVFGRLEGNFAEEL